MNEINKALSQDIELIKSFSIKYLDPENIISIYLYGGYGRDEGSWVIEEVDGQRKVRPYNDYDIAIIVKNRQVVLNLHFFMSLHYLAIQNLKDNEKINKLKYRLQKC